MAEIRSGFSGSYFGAQLGHDVGRLSMHSHLLSNWGWPCPPSRLHSAASRGHVPQWGVGVVDLPTLTPEPPVLHGPMHVL